MFYQVLSTLKTCSLSYFYQWIASKFSFAASHYREAGRYVYRKLVEYLGAIVDRLSGAKAQILHQAITVALAKI